MFLQLGCNGCVILFNETEMIGRWGKKARLNAYKNMDYFLVPNEKLQAIYTIFALTASFREDAIEVKHEFENLQSTAFEQKNYEEVEKMLKNLVLARQM